MAASAVVWCLCASIGVAPDEYAGCGDITLVLYGQIVALLACAAAWGWVVGCDEGDEGKTSETDELHCVLRSKKVADRSE